MPFFENSQRRFSDDSNKLIVNSRLKRILLKKYINLTQLKIIQSYFILVILSVEQQGNVIELKIKNKLTAFR